MRFFHSVCLVVTLPVLSFTMERSRTPEEQLALAVFHRLSIDRPRLSIDRPASQPMDIPLSPRNRSFTSSPNPHGQHSCSSASYSSDNSLSGGSPDSANSARERSPERKNSHSVPPMGRRNSWGDMHEYGIPSASHGSWYRRRPGF